MKKILLFTTLFLTLSVATFAHQPKVTLYDDSSLANPIQINNPDISQVFYGDLDGQPEYYKFSLTQATDSLLGILVPISEKNFTSVELIDENNMSIGLLKEEDYEKGVYFENFGGDSYIKGPEIKTLLPQGDYTLKIFNKINTGKYALVIGEKESFNFLESLKTLAVLPIIKIAFFNKPILELFVTFLAIILLLKSLIYRRFGREFSNKFWIGTALLLISAVAIIWRNPVEILGLFRALVILISLGLHSVALYKQRLGKKMFRTVLIFWLIVVFLTITI
jgi:hypothetical protein